jgi:hypothetical protein
MQAVQHYENLMLQQAQQQQSIPTTPEGTLPGTNNYSAQSNGFSTFAFPSLTAQVHSTPGSLRGGRGRSSSMLSNVSGFTDGFEDAASPSMMTAHNPFDFYGALNGKTGGHDTGSISLSSGTSSQGSSQRDPLSPVPNKSNIARSSPKSSNGSSGLAKPAVGSR